MKKLMIAMAAMTAGVAMADIVSSSVVGYQQNATIKGNQGVGATFLPVSGTAKMGDITVTGYGDSYGDNGIDCCKLDTFGRSQAKMFWVDYTEGNETWYGWYNDDWSVCYNDVELQPGEGVWFKSPNAAYKVQSSGAVLKETLPVTLIKGNQLCPNPTPVVVSMGNVWMTGYGDSYADNGIDCCKLDTFGRSQTKMFWADYTEGNDAWYGWYNDDWSTSYNDVELQPGESVWLKSPSASYLLNWPKAL